MHETPPEKWIHALNRKYPSLWTDLRKAYENPRKCLQPEDMQCLVGIPSWCPMPGLFPFMYMARRYGMDYCFRNNPELLSIQTMYLWRAGKGVFRFDPELYRELTNQPLVGDLPNELFFRLPEWAVYIETPGMKLNGTEIDGFIAHLDYDLVSRHTNLQFAIFEHGCLAPKMSGFQLGKGGIAQGLQRTETMVQNLDKNLRQNRKVDPAMRDVIVTVFASMVQLLLYLCSEEPDMPAIEHPRNRRTLSGGVRSSAEAKVWDVGIRIGAAMRRASTTADGEPVDGDTSPTEGRSHARPRAHIRSAHWTTYWTGPRSGEQKPIVRWIPPLPINMDWKQSMPTVIHPVLSSSPSSS